MLGLEESSTDDAVHITAADYIFDEAAEDVASEDDYDDNEDESDDGGGRLDQGEEEQCFVERCVRICSMRFFERLIFMYFLSFAAIRTGGKGARPWTSF